MKEQSEFTEAIRKYSRIPLFTLFMVSLCCSLHLVGIYETVDVDDDDVCLKAHGIIRLNEVHRLFSYVFFHKKLLHLAVTMIPMAVLGWIIEKRLGTILFFLNVFIIWLFSTLLEVAMVTMLYHISHDLFHGCTAGTSGIVFGLVVLVTKFMKTEDQRPWLGIPSIVYPLTLLVFYYLLIHRGSLFLHLGGIFAGYACKHEVMTWCIPSPEAVVAWERSALCQPLAYIPCFVRYIEPNRLPQHNSQEPI